MDCLEPDVEGCSVDARYPQVSDGPVKSLHLLQVSGGPLRDGLLPLEAPYTLAPSASLFAAR
jgi:hypothetical protein